MTGPQNIRKRLRPKASKGNSKDQPEATVGPPVYIRHKVVDHCLGSGWRNLDIDCCNEPITTYQYKLEGEPSKYSDFRHYMRCADCSAAHWHKRRVKEATRGYLQG